MERARSVRISELNPHLMCVLCGGYYVDATTIIECLHSFCKTCIVRYLDSSKFCPICDVQVHKTKPLLNIRPDRTLQELVYKLVPGLYTREVLKRREFYRRHAASNPGLSSSDGDLSSSASSECSGPVTSSPGVGPVGMDTMSLSLELSTTGRPVERPKGRNSSHRQDSLLQKRFLLCPANFTIGYLKKFIRMKLEIDPAMEVDVFHTDEPLSDSYALMDIAYIYSWFKTAPLPLYFSVFATPLPPPVVKKPRLSIPTVQDTPAKGDDRPARTSTAGSPNTPGKLSTKRKSSGGGEEEGDVKEEKIPKCSVEEPSRQSPTGRDLSAGKQSPKQSPAGTKATGSPLAKEAACKVANKVPNPDKVKSHKMSERKSPKKEEKSTSNTSSGKDKTNLSYHKQKDRSTSDSSHKRKLDSRSDTKRSGSKDSRSAEASLVYMFDDSDKDWSFAYKDPKSKDKQSSQTDQKKTSTDEAGSSNTKDKSHQSKDAKTSKLTVSTIKTSKSESSKTSDTTSCSSVNSSQKDDNARSKSPKQPKESSKSHVSSPRADDPPPESSNGCKISTSDSGKSIVVSIPKHLLERSNSEKEKKKKKKDKDHHHRHHRKHRRQEKEGRKRSGAESPEESAKSSSGGSAYSSPTSDRGGSVEDPDAKTPPVDTVKQREPVLQQLQDEMDKCKDEQNRKQNETASKQDDKSGSKETKSVVDKVIVVKPSASNKLPNGKINGADPTRTKTTKSDDSFEKKDKIVSKTKSTEDKLGMTKQPQTTKSNSVKPSPQPVTVNGGSADKTKVNGERKRDGDKAIVLKLPTPSRPSIPVEELARNKTPKKSILSKITSHPRMHRPRPPMKPPTKPPTTFNPTIRGNLDTKPRPPAPPAKLPSTMVTVDLTRPDSHKAPIPWKSLSTLAEAGRKIQESANTALGRNSPPKSFPRTWIDDRQKTNGTRPKTATVDISDVKPLATETFSAFGSPTMPKGMKTYSKKDKLSHKNPNVLNSPSATQSSYEGAFKTFLANADSDSESVAKKPKYSLCSPNLDDGGSASESLDRKRSASPKRDKPPVSPQSNVARHLHGHKVIGQLQMVYETMQKPTHPEVCRKLQKPTSPQKSPLGTADKPTAVPLPVVDSVPSPTAAAKPNSNLTTKEAHIPAIQVTEPTPETVNYSLPDEGKKPTPTTTFGEEIGEKNLDTQDTKDCEDKNSETSQTSKSDTLNEETTADKQQEELKDTADCDTEQEKQESESSESTTEPAETTIYVVVDKDSESPVKDIPSPKAASPESAPSPVRDENDKPSKFIESTGKSDVSDVTPDNSSSVSAVTPNNTNTSDVINGNTASTSAVTNDNTSCTSGVAPGNNSTSGCSPGNHSLGGRSPQNNNLSSAACSQDVGSHCDQCQSASTPDAPGYDKTPQEAPLNLHKPRSRPETVPCPPVDVDP